ERTWSWWGRVIFYHSDVDALHASVVAAGYRPDTAPRDAEWGERFFHLTDPDGHELSFAKPLGDKRVRGYKRREQPPAMTDLEQKPRPWEISFRFIGQPIVRKEDARLTTGRPRTERPAPLQARFQRRRSSLRGDAAVRACAGAHPRHRRDARQGHAGRARRLHRRRLPRRRTHCHSARSAAQDQIRHEARGR